MSERKSKTRPEGQDINEKQVEAYLSANPDFFAARDNLLLQLALPHGPDRTISLVERQVGLLRERNRTLRRELDALLVAAERNDEIFAKCRELLLALLDARDTDSFFNALEQSFRNDFKSDAYSLMIFSEHAKQVNHFTSCVPAQSAHQYVGALMDAETAYLGVLRSSEQDFLFRHASSQVKSAAVLPVRRNQLYALLAIGSRDPNYFKSGMGTLFIGFISDVLARLLPRYVYLDPDQ